MTEWAVSLMTFLREQGLTWLRRTPIKDSVKAQSVTYSTKAFVRTRRPWNTWVEWHKGGPDVLVRSAGLEVSAPHGMLLESRDICIPATTSTMWLDTVGWAGTPLMERRCIHLFGIDDRGRLEIAVTPEDEMKATWEALLRAGDAHGLRLADPDVGGEASQHDMVTADPGRVSWLLSS